MDGSGADRSANDASRRMPLYRFWNEITTQTLRTQVQHFITSFTSFYVAVVLKCSMFPVCSVCMFLLFSVFVFLYLVFFFFRFFFKSNFQITFKLVPYALILFNFQIHTDMVWCHLKRYDITYYDIASYIIHHTMT